MLMIETKSKLYYPRGKPANGEVLWRCEARTYSVILDAEAEKYGVSDPQLEMTWYPIQRRTPQGAWIEGRFVRLTAVKRWACPTEREALEEFIRRKRLHVGFLEDKLRKVEFALQLANHHLSKIS